MAQTANVTTPAPVCYIFLLRNSFSLQRLGAFPHKGNPTPAEKKKPPPGYICYRCGATGKATMLIFLIVLQVQMDIIFMTALRTETQLLMFPSVSQPCTEFLRALLWSKGKEKASN